MRNSCTPPPDDARNGGVWCGRGKGRGSRSSVLDPRVGHACISPTQLGDLWRTRLATSSNPPTRSCAQMRRRSRYRGLCTYRGLCRYRGERQRNSGPVHPTYNSYFLIYFFSQNNIFFSPPISQQCSRTEPPSSKCSIGT
jgi:hypothetical protein